MPRIPAELLECQNKGWIRGFPIDGNRDGNIASPCQPKTGTGSQSLLLRQADLAIRYT